jgi:dTMP kinase
MLDIETPIGLKRAKKRLGGKKPDRIEKLKLSFHQRIREGYLALARAESGRIRIVDVDRDIKKTERAIKRCVDKFLQKRKPVRGK